MRIFNVTPSIPPALKPIEELAYNLWHVWNYEAEALFSRIDPDLWKEVDHNPVALLRKVSQERINELKKDDGFMSHMERVYKDFRRYIEEKKRISIDGREVNFTVAYFSMEYGIAESLPIYSGGLGILAGDYFKSSSDLNLPVVGIGLMYQKDYFRQYLNPDGWQQENIVTLNVHSMPMKLLRNGEKPLEVLAELGDKEVKIHAWEVSVGRLKLYLLDTVLKENSPDDREITSQLYVGDRATRLKQEMVLSQGGLKLLEKLGIEPRVYHLNEGHCALVSVERMKRLIKEQGLSFDEAQEFVRSTTAFTTHTPIPAGNEIYDPALISKYLSKTAKDLGLEMDRFLRLGRINPENSNEPFCFTTLALKLSYNNNGVSRLHEKTAKKMWKDIWKGTDEMEIPITHITNGVHIPSWISSEHSKLYERFLGSLWSEDPDNEKVWERARKIPDEELWRTHQLAKSRLIEFIRERLHHQLKKRGAPEKEAKEAWNVLSPEALTIGFARRFVAYKRAYLIFSDPERLAKILNDPERPVQIIFAGKAHPMDRDAKNIIKQIIHYTKQSQFRSRIVFLEDYDIITAKYIMSGVDLWLNNPRRPLEACGTSGMKIAANAGINLSVLDGWWEEAYDPEIGWVIGAGEEYQDREYQDYVESRTIYDRLENEVAPMFYQRDSHGIPREWVEKMKNSLSKVSVYYNSHRMVEEYLRKFYLEAAKKWEDLGMYDFGPLKDYITWLRQIMSKWENVEILDFKMQPSANIKTGEKIMITSKINTGGIAPQELKVEACFGQVDYQNRLIEKKSTELSVEKEEGNGISTFKGEFICQESGRYGLKIRVFPKHEFMKNPYYYQLYKEKE